MANLQIQSTFKRTDQLERLIDKHFTKLQRFCQRIRNAKVYMKKERKAHESDVVTVTLAIDGGSIIAVTAKDTLFEKSVKQAFIAVERKLKKINN